MPRRPLRLRASFALTATLVAGCSALPATGPARPGFDLLGPGRSLGIQIHLGAKRRVQTVPNNWDSVQFRLASSTAMLADRQQTVTKAGNFGDLGSGTPATGSVLLFNGARPGTYELYASTYDGLNCNAVGETFPTLSGGASTSVTITLRTLPQWTNGVIAGIGAAGSSGDSGDPMLASFDQPGGLALGGDGAIYVADRNNNKVRKINPAGTTITTLVGDGTTGPLQSPRGLAYDAADDALFIADTLNHRVRIVTTLGGVATLAVGTIATTGDPLALAYDNTHTTLYVAETNHCLETIYDPLGAQTRRLYAGAAGVSGNTISPPATDSVRLNTPSGLALDATATTLYVADTGNHRVLKIVLATGGVSLLAGDGSDDSAGDGKTAASASLMTPSDLAFDVTDGGRLYVLDSGAFVIRAITLANGLIATVYGTGSSAYDATATAAQAVPLYAPAGLAFDAGSIFVSEAGAGGNRLRKGS